MGDNDDELLPGTKTQLQDLGDKLGMGLEELKAARIEDGSPYDRRAAPIRPDHVALTGRPRETPSERRRRERGGIVVQAASGPNRRARRAAQAKGAARPTLDVNCNVCRVVFVRLPQPRTEAERLAGNEQVARAFRQHVRVTGCVRLEDVAPVSLPQVGGRSAEEPKPVDPSSPEGAATES